MKYIYDILLNFKDQYYDFFEWNKNDNIIHIRKIPIVKISSEDFNNIKNNKVIIDMNDLSRVVNKTEVFTSKNIKILEYTILISDGNSVIGITKNNKNIKKSSLLIDEEIDILEEIKYLEETKLNYKILKEENNEIKTRKQTEMEKYLNNNIFKINDLEKLKYIYFECFDKKEKDKKIILKKIKESILDYNTCEKIYNFLKLIEVKKNV